jgi:two-component system CheB/CheR fusion protein
MAELLQRFTAMKVVEAKDRMKVRPETVIVLPPNREMTIKSRILRLVKPSEPRGRRLPIDCFFRALAMDQQEAAIGVILSGMGADGSHGLKIIKEYAGAIFVQDPAGAGFDAMPRSAIETGFVDAVAPAGELPKKILDYLHHVPNRGVTSAPAAADEQAARSSLEKILVLLKIRVGHDFSLYKMASVRRRIERRMGLVQVKGIPDYIRLLKEDPREIELLAKDLLIGVTSFFRDPEVWEELKKKAIPPLLAGRRGHAAAPIRAWVAGCSTGEEAYTLAMIVKEAMEKSGSSRGMMLQIFATDLDANAIEKARAGLYPAAIEADLSAVRLKRFFTREEKGYRVNQEIREAVTFAPHNLVSDPPFSRLDILTCRNLLIYFSLELQKKILPVFHYALAPGGVMVLGSSESIGQHTDLFAPLSASNRLYRRGKGPVRREIEFPSSFSAARPLLGTKPAAPKGKAAKTKARAKVTITVEDFQAAEEELKSTNEELQSANEELQSTNEELTTSKEEMQSLNEELQTVNVELQSKVDELSSANNDMKNLLNSTDIATVFLDSSLHVRRFTTQATRLFKLIPGDLGRPLSDIVTDLHYPALLDDAAEVLNTLVFSEREVATGDGRWFQIKIMPYRTLENVIDGVVITFNEVSRAKQLEAELRALGQVEQQT